MDDYVALEHWYISLGAIETFVPWETIEAVIKDVSLEFFHRMRTAGPLRRFGVPSKGDAKESPTLALELTFQKKSEV